MPFSKIISIDMAKYDFLIIGAGVFGITVARKLTDAGARCLIVEKEPSVGGMCATEEKDGIMIHKYGEHILHTDDDEVWDFILKYCTINHVNKYMKCMNKNRYYSFPLTMNLFSEVYDKIYPKDMKSLIAADVKNYGVEYQRNFEEDMIYKCGYKAYSEAVRGYYEKLYGDECKNLSTACGRDIDTRYDYSDGYYTEMHVGVPVEGYTKFLENMLGDDIDIMFNKDFIKSRESLMKLCSFAIYTGPVDRLCGYVYGPLQWRKLDFEMKDFSSEGEHFLGIGTVRVSDPDNGLLEMTEHKSIVDTASDSNYVTFIKPGIWHQDDTGHFCVNNEESEALLDRYIAMFREEFPNVICGGRQGIYRNITICESIRLAMDLAEQIISGLRTEA